MRVCKVMLSYPTSDSPGSGLSGLLPTIHSAAETRFIAPDLGELIVALPGNVELRKIRTVFGPAALRSRSRSRMRRIVQLLFLVEFAARALPEITRFRPDVLVFGIMNVLPIVLIGRLRGCRLAMTLHNYSEVEYIGRFKRLSGPLLRKLDLIFVVSDPMKTGLEKMISGVPVVVRPTGVDLNRFYPAGIERKHQLITVGSFKWKKGYEYLLGAMQIIVRSRPDCKLLVVGDGAERGRIEARIEELGLNESVRLVGMVSQVELVELLRESAVFVLASLREGLPKALLEALATGTPAVVTSGSNAGEFIAEVGIEVPSGDPHALAEAALELLGDADRWGKFARNAPAVAARYSWPAVAKIEHEALQALQG